MKENFEYRAQARQALEGRWNEAVAVSLVLFVVIGLASGLSVTSELTSGFMSSFSYISGTLISLLVATPLSVGFSAMFLMFLRGAGELTIEAMLEPVRTNYRNIFITMLLMSFIVAVVTAATFFLLCIPGIILGLAYSMVPFLLKDYPELEWRDLLRTSREMMKGHKWDFFCLQLSFIGWILAAIATCGIGFLWLLPYMTAAEAAFYEDLKAETITEVADDQVQEAEVVE